MSGEPLRYAAVACGKRIPESEHAVSVSLPTMRDVIGYEQQRPAVMQQICSGYPRFISHWMVQRVQALLGERVVALRDEAAVGLLQRRLGVDLEVVTGVPFGAVRLPADRDVQLEDALHRFLQHTGLQLSSREAEDWLVEQDVLADETHEAVPSVAHPADVVRETLALAYCTHAAQVALFPSGMAAYYTVFDALDRLQRPVGRDVWLQVGWLYLDTSALLERYAGETRVFAVDALDELEAYLRHGHDRVAAVTTEIMTNPLLQTADIMRLSSLCRQYDIPFLVDTSMPTPINVDVLEQADIVLESLTKFAGGHADVMAGAAIFRPRSAWADAVRNGLCQSQPYHRDLNVLAYHIRDYRTRMQQINQHAAHLADYFECHPGVRTVFGAGQDGSRSCYDAVKRPDGGYGGVISVVFQKPLEQIYDRLPLLKGPSFGTVFTLCMPYVYLAHFDLVSTDEGRAKLQRYGVDPELLRISVGLEPVDAIIAAFEAGMQG